MKKLFKTLLVTVLTVVMVMSVAACTGNKVQGVDTEKHVITVGNTAATSGVFQSVGEPFNYALKARMWYYTEKEDGYKDENGNKYTIELKHYDDGFDGAVGTTYTEKLVEDDKVFALVGHFGSNTVAATVDYIESKGIPMVYGVCGVPQLFETKRNVMTVQPIYNTEGMSMLATAAAKTDGNIGLGATKIGVIATTDEAGAAIKAGIQREQKVLKLTTNKDIFYYDVDASATDFSSAVNGCKSNGCDVVIVAANQAPFVNISNQFVTSNYDNVKIITSYVSANYATMGGLLGSGVITATREVYAGAWVVTGSAPSETKGWKDFVEYVKVLTAYDKAQGKTLLKDTDATYGAYIKLYFAGMEWAKDGVSPYFLNSYAIAGYVAGDVFVQGLSRCSGKKLTWKSYIDAMESADVNVPMGKSISYANGKRIGIDALAVNKYTVANLAVGEVYREITFLTDIEAKNGFAK